MNQESRNEAIFECHKEGLSQTVIGRIFKLSQSRISKILHLVKSGNNKPKEETRGSKSKLSSSQKEALKVILKDAPSEYGYRVWDKWSIKDLIANRFEVNYHENHIFRIMQCINFSSQKPQQKDYRQDAKKVAEFKANVAPSIKKSRAGK